MSIRDLLYQDILSADASRLVTVVWSLDLEITAGRSTYCDWTLGLTQSDEAARWFCRTGLLSAAVCPCAGCGVKQPLTVYRQQQPAGEAMGWLAAVKPNANNIWLLRDDADELDEQVHMLTMGSPDGTRSARPIFALCCRSNGDDVPNDAASAATVGRYVLMGLTWKLDTVERFLEYGWIAVPNTYQVTEVALPTPDE